MLDDSFQYQTPEIPEGMERSFPFFLDSRQPVGRPSCLLLKKAPCNSKSSPSFSSSKFKGGIPVNELLNGCKSCCPDFIQMCGCSFVVNHTIGTSTITTVAINEESAMQSSSWQADFPTLTVQCVHDECEDEDFEPKVVRGQKATNTLS